MLDYYTLLSDSRHLRSALTDLQRYQKTKSMLQLKALGLPVLDGIILTKWSSQAHSAVLQLCRDRGWESLLLRHDKIDERPPYPRGGFLVSVDRLREVTTTYFREDRIVLLLEPHSPYENSYNINSLFQDATNLLFEIVGPGFDASDLQRGDITPHEVIRIDRALLKKYASVSRFLIQDPEILPDLIEYRSGVGKSQYHRSATQRLLKIGKKLIELGEVSLESNHLDTKILVALTKEYLRRCTKSLLLDRLEEYQPIPYDALGKVCAHLYDLPERLREFHRSSFPMVVSASFVDQGKALVFWDVVLPLNKYDTTVRI